MAKRRGNGGGLVYRRKDGLWVGQYKVHAPTGTKTKYIYAKTRKDAAVPGSCEALGAHQAPHHPNHQLYGPVLAQLLLAYQCAPRLEVLG